jgi:hypothetical protein
MLWVRAAPTHSDADRPVQIATALAADIPQVACRLMASSPDLAAGSSIFLS